MKTEIYYTNTLDPWHNLAVEEYLLEQLPIDHCLLYLWQNQNTVVIGKNQNAWRECRIEALERDNGKLARRISGGGAVYHDTGNLNFSFIVSRELYDVQRQLRVILNGLANLGIQAQFSGRNDLTVEGRKFSGNAFCQRSRSALHHGTILVASDFAKLTRYLQISPEKIRSKGVQSVQARVVNLQEFRPSLTIEDTAEALIKSFTQVYAPACTCNYDIGSLDAQDIAEIYRRHASWHWRFGQTPQFDIHIDTRFAWGGLEIGLQLKKARIVAAYIYSDALDEVFIESLPPILQGEILHSTELGRRLRAIPPNDDTQKQMCEDIACWLESKNF